MQEHLYRWVGIGPNGSSRAGARELTPNQMAAWVRSLHTAGWIHLTVTLDGNQVGGIGGRRGGPWWAEA
jgi:hypothetical protein